MLSATYGLNVEAHPGNVADHVAAACDGRTRCGSGALPRTLVVPPEAGQVSVVTLSCR